jgi:tetratricopeptide (TPR) repeat protein
MSLPRVALLVLALMLASITSAWSQSDPLQEANQFFRQGQLDRAMERVNSFLATRPKDARGRFLKGLILTEQNRPNEAIKVFTELSQDFPELPEPYNNLAVLYAAQGAYDKARNSLEMAIRTHPSYATAHENLGDIYAKMASQAYDRALQLDRSNQAAQGKLNLIKDIFAPTATARAKPATTRPEPVAVASTQPAPAATKPAPAPAPATAAPVKPPVPTSAVVAAAEPPAPPKPEARRPDAVAMAKPAESGRSEAPAAAAVAAHQNTDAVLRAVASWARAWASNDVPGYLGHYSDDFQPPRGLSRRAWEAERKSRIAKPRKIEVDVHDPQVAFDPADPNRATVTFRQHYRSGSLNVTDRKTLVLVRSGNRWVIQQERVGS